MNTRLMMIGSALVASLLALPAMAQPSQGMGMGGMGGMGPGMGQRGMAPRDCTQAPNPEACKAHQQVREMAREACKDKTGPDHKACLRAQFGVK